MLSPEVIADLKRVDPGIEYFAVTLLANSDGEPYWSTQTLWAGWVNDVPGREIRVASPVIADRMAECWDAIGEPHIVVNSVPALAVLYAVGGNSLMARQVVEAELPRLLEPSDTAFAVPNGFTAAAALPDSAFKRAPRPRLRMEILKRDDFRCRICGRRADDHSDIELHVHHIRPWADGGLTEVQNLITLCSTCHHGLNPHGDKGLFEILHPGSFNKSIEATRSDYLLAVQRYRASMKRELERHQVRTGDA